MSSIQQEIARKLGLAEPRIQAALTLFGEGCTLPFIARYRKEKTGHLDEVQLASIQDLHSQFSERDQRRTFIVETLRQQGKLDSKLLQSINQAQTKAELEDLYAPFKKKRKTRSTQKEPVNGSMC